MKYLLVLALATAVAACTIQANVAQPKITVECVELVQGGDPIEEECQPIPDSGRDSEQ